MMTMHSPFVGFGCRVIRGANFRIQRSFHAALLTRMRSWWRDHHNQRVGIRNDVTGSEPHGVGTAGNDTGSRCWRWKSGNLVKISKRKRNHRFWRVSWWPRKKDTDSEEEKIVWLIQHRFSSESWWQTWGRIWRTRMWRRWSGRRTPTGFWLIKYQEFVAMWTGNRWQIGELRLSLQFDIPFICHSCKCELEDHISTTCTQF